MTGKKVSEEKVNGVVALVGEENAKDLLDMTKQATDILEEKGVGWKEWMETALEGEDKEGKAPVKATKPTPTKVSDEEDEDEDEDEEDEEEEAKAKKAKKDSKEADVFEMELSDDLVKEIAGQVDVTPQVMEALKEWHTLN